MTDRFGIFSLKQAEVVSGNQQKYFEDDADGDFMRTFGRRLQVPRPPISGISVYATADGLHAVTVTSVGDAPTCNFEDTVQVGRLGAYIGSVPYGSPLVAPLAVTIGRADDLTGFKLTDAEKMAAADLAYEIAASAREEVAAPRMR